MSPMKIPDSILENLRCQCGQYLSKTPVSIQNGKSVCSDCIDIQDPTSVVVSQNFHYEALAGLFAFPCRYKLQGCPKYIEFNKLENHEAECLYRVYECPINLHSPSKCNWKGTTSQLCQHFETQHPELYLQAESPKFEINFEDHEVYRLIKVEDILLLLQTKCSLENGKIWFSMVCFKQEDSVELINYAIKLNSGTSNGRIMKLEVTNPLPITQMQMIPTLSLNVNIETLKDIFKQPDFIESQWDINIAEELKLKVKAQQELEEDELYNARNVDIKCVNCGFYMVPPIYRCQKGHKTCVDCKGYYNECKTCQDILVVFTAAEDLEKIAECEQHYCRWIKCRKILSCNELGEHEQNCPYRIYKCPQCNIWSGALQQLIEHFKLVHPEVVLLLTPSIRLNIRKGIIYAITHNEIFKVNVDVTSGLFAGIKINVWFLGSSKFVNCWEYAIKKNSQKIQTHFPKQITNNYSCTVMFGKDEEIKNVPTSEATPFTFRMPPTVAVNLPTSQTSSSSLNKECQNVWTLAKKEESPFKPVFGTPSSFSTPNSQTVGLAQGNGFQKKQAVATPKSNSVPKSNIIKDAILNLNTANNLECYTLNISQIKN